jgi:hypothetical protein
MSQHRRSLAGAAACFLRSDGVKVRSVIATAVGLPAAVAVGVGTYGILTIADCESTGACQLPSSVVLITFNVGLPVAIIAIVAGGGVLVAGALFIAIGAGAMASGSQFGWLFGGAFLVVGLIVAVLVARLRRAALGNGAAMGALMRSAFEGLRNTVGETGQPAVGVVLSVADTGTTLNDDPLARLRLRIEPADGSAPFEAEAKKLVPRLSPPRPGDRFTVEYDAADRSRVAVLEALPAESRHDSLVDQLAKLDELHRSGALNQTEFEAAKTRLLYQGDSG